VFLRVTPVLQPNEACGSGKARAIAGGKDRRIAGAALRVHHDAVRHPQAGRRGERIVRSHAGADDDVIADV